MAKDFLAIMATSAPIERQFSIFGNIITKNRNRINIKTAINTVLLKSWGVPEKTVDELDESDSDNDSDNSDNGEEVVLFN